MELKCRRTWRSGAWLLLGFITYLSLMPHPPEPFSFHQVDKLEHGLAYMTLSLWFCQAYRATALRWVILLIIWGVGIEFVQGWTGYRMYDEWDMVANSTGALLGGFFARHTFLGQVFMRVERMVLK